MFYWNNFEQNLQFYQNLCIIQRSHFQIYQVNDQFGYGIGFTRQGDSNISNNKPGLILPEYTRVDFAAYYDVSEDLAIRLNIENLTDKVYFPHSHSTHQASVGEEVNARLSITSRF